MFLLKVPSRLPAGPCTLNCWERSKVPPNFVENAYAFATFTGPPSIYCSTRQLSGTVPCYFRIARLFVYIYTSWCSASRQIVNITTTPKSVVSIVFLKMSKVLRNGPILAGTYALANVLIKRLFQLRWRSTQLPRPLSTQ